MVDRARVGVVATFDDPAGYGWLRDEDNDRQWFFHYVAIADGSRTIEVGTRVVFEVVPGLLGRWEAGSIRPPGPTVFATDPAHPIASSSNVRQ
ncbi:MAG: cold shock domain-containing protein [Acidimicrobiales bacterium]